MQNLPYVIHTNRELGLMLAGSKPLAMFVDGKDCFPDVMLRYLRMFDRHVRLDRFIRRDHVNEVPASAAPATHRILFALPSEVWRIDAMIALKASSTWTDEHERREGELLGYDQWMNDYWIAQMRSARDSG
jgi:hypothetical protein